MVTCTVLHCYILLFYDAALGWHSTVPAWCGDARVALVLGALGLVVGAILGYLRYITRWFRILLLRNGFETYYRPNGAWAALVRQHQHHWAQICLTSPIIEMEGHQYLEVLYLDLWNILWPTRARCRFVILVDAEQAEHQPKVIQRVLGLRMVLLNGAVRSAVRSMEKAAQIRKVLLKYSDYIPLFLVWWTDRYIDIGKHVCWYAEHQDQLRVYVSADRLSSFLDKLGQMDQALQQVSTEALRALAVQKHIHRHRCVPVEAIMALQTLGERVVRGIEQVFRNYEASSDLSMLL